MLKGNKANKGLIDGVENYRIIGIKILLILKNVLLYEVVNTDAVVENPKPSLWLSLSTNICIHISPRREKVKNCSQVKRSQSPHLSCHIPICQMTCLCKLSMNSSSFMNSRINHSQFSPSTSPSTWNKFISLEHMLVHFISKWPT